MVSQGIVIKWLGLVATLAVACSLSVADAATLDTIKQRGVLNCGANGQLAGFGIPDAQGNWTGFDVDLCRAIAAAIFNDAGKVKFVALTAKDRFTALQSNDVDVLIRNTTWTSSRDTQLGLNATGVNYYDGQGFLVRKDLKVNSAALTALKGRMNSSFSRTCSLGRLSTSVMRPSPTCLLPDQPYSAPVPAAAPP